MLKERICFYFWLHIPSILLLIQAFALMPKHVITFQIHQCTEGYVTVGDMTHLSLGSLLSSPFSRRPHPTAPLNYKQLKHRFDLECSAAMVWWGPTICHSLGSWHP